MPGSKDIYTSANILIKNYGFQGAIEFAVERIEDLFDKGDEMGMAVWDSIIDAIESLRDGVPANDW